MDVQENGDSVSTLPSVGAPLSASSAMRPPAPGLFSTTATLRVYDEPASFSPTLRATLSPALPAGKP